MAEEMIDNICQHEDACTVKPCHGDGISPQHLGPCIELILYKVMLQRHSLPLAPGIWSLSCVVVVLMTRVCCTQALWLCAGWTKEQALWCRHKWEAGTEAGIDT